MKNPNVQTRLFVLFFTVIIMLALNGCDPFVHDGITNSAEVAQHGYFYLTEQSTNSLIMLDYNKREIKRWSLNNIDNTGSLQGITFDGQYLWFAFSGNTKKIMKVNAEADTLAIMQSIAAPSKSGQGSGTIRGIAYGGGYLWSVNSGGTTTPALPYIFQIDVATGKMRDSIPLYNTAEPRGLCYSDAKNDAYNLTVLAAGLYFTEKDQNKLYYCNPAKRGVVDTVCTLPVSPRGIAYTSPYGIAKDASFFYSINNSVTAPHMFQLDLAGNLLSRYDFTNMHPTYVVWSSYDVRGGGPPAIGNISPAKGVIGTGLAVDISGAGFKSGLTVDFGSNITIDTLQLVNSNQLHLYIRIDTNAVLGLRTVSMQNPNGLTASLTNGFKVLAAPEVDYIYVAESVLSRIYKIRLSDSTLVQYWSTSSINAVKSLQGLSFDGTDFWMSNSGTDKHVYKLVLPDADTTATATQESFAVSTSGTLRSSTFANGFMWQVISETTPTLGKIVRIDPATGTVLDTIITPGSNPRGATWLNGVLYVDDTDLDKVYQYNLTAKTWTEIWSTPVTTGSKFATGLTNDGSNFWIANSSTTDDHLFKVTPTGSIVYVLNVLPVVISKLTPTTTDMGGITGIVFVTK